MQDFGICERLEGRMDSFNIGDASILIFYCFQLPRKFTDLDTGYIRPLGKSWSLCLFSAWSTIRRWGLSRHQQTKLLASCSRFSKWARWFPRRICWP